MIRWLSFFLLFPFHCSILALHFSITPSDNAFFLHSNAFSSTNFTNRVLFLQGDCPFSTEQRIIVSSGSRVQNSRLFSYLHNFNCAVSVKLVSDIVTLDRSYVDVLAIADTDLLTFFKQTVCVNVQITNPSAETVSSTCHLSPFEESKQTCLLRIVIPHKWFGAVGHNSTRQTLVFSWAVSSTCNAPFYDRPQTPIKLLPFIDSVQAHTLSKHDEIDLSLLSRANISLSLKSLNSLFIHLSYNSTDDYFGSIEIRLFIDSRVEIVAVNPLSIEEWTVRVQSAQRPEVFTSFLCVPKKKIKSWDGYVFSLLLKMKGNIAENKKLEKGEEGLEASLHWEIRRRTDGNSTKEIIDRVATKFRVTSDMTYAIVPVAKSTDIINTGILTGKQASTSMKVFSVTLGGIAKDLATANNLHCISAEPKILKTSPMCSSVYTDGSEMRGSANIDIHVSYEKWTTSISFTVWFPRLPITIWLKDPVLNGITNWPIAKWKNLKEGKHKKRAAKQFTCSTRFQQSEVTVLVQFQVSDERTGEKIFMAGRDVHFDMTKEVANSLMSLDRNTVIIKNLNSRVIAQAVNSGSTRIVLKRAGPGSVEYGGATVVVTEDPVTVTRLTVVPIVEININVEPMPGKRAQYTATAEIETIFTQRYQHGSFFYQLQYSDDATESLDDVAETDFNLGAVSTDERVVALSHKTRNAVEMIALDDLTDPAVEFELRAPAHCLESDALPLASLLVPIHLQFNDADSSRLAAVRAFSTSNSTHSPIPLPPDSQSRSDILFILIVLIVLIVTIRFLLKRARNFNGYEKLVVPLLSRLSSSSSSGGGDENTKEWVWLSKSRIDTNSIGSRYSQKSTINLPEQSSPSYDDNTHTSISYRGSEISVFISPTPVVTVNAERGVGGSWRSGGRSRTRAARHALVDSSSDHNLARIVARTGSWREEGSWQNQTWNAKRRPTGQPNYNGMMRESIA